MSDARSYAVWPDPSLRSRVIESHSRGVDHQSRTGLNFLLKSNISSVCPDNMVNFSPLAAEIGWWVWGTPAHFIGFHVLASLLHRCCAMDVNQTLHVVWAVSWDGTLYIRFRVLLLPNGILKGAEFTASKSCIGSRPSDHYFRSVSLFVCLFVCLFVQSFSESSLIRFRSN